MFEAQSLLIKGIPLTISARQRPVPSYGMLAEYADPALVADEEEAFEKAMEEKHYKNAPSV